MDADKVDPLIRQMSQANDPRLAALNGLRYSVWVSRGAGLCLGVDGLLLILPGQSSSRSQKGAMGSTARLIFESSIDCLQFCATAFVPCDPL